MSLDLSGLGSVADFGKALLDRVWVNKNDPAYLAAQVALQNAKDAGSLKEMDDEFQLSLEQIRANAAEAAQPGFHFRDAAGWVCVINFAFLALKAPIEWVCIIAGHTIALPTPDTSVTLPMLLGLLGLGGMHMYQQTRNGK